MKSLMFFTAFLIASPAFASSQGNIPVPSPRPSEHLHCSFTEPFINLEWDESTQELSLMTPEDVDMNDQGEVFVRRTVKKGFHKIRTGNKTSELRSDTDELVVRLTLDFKGNDGMSDKIMPYSAEAFNNYGGCSSNYYADKN